MPSFIQYIDKRFSAKSEDKIAKANAVIAEGQALGLSLTLRQIYYQFVAEGWIPNNQKEYDKLQELLVNARLAGRVDWEAMEDRTRNLQGFRSDGTPEEELEYLAYAYNRDKWTPQPHHVEVWVEKDALVGVVEMASRKWQTSFFSCRGYASASEIWNAAQRLATIGKPTTILYVGDHDPSGIDMGRDIQERLTLFEADNVKLKRIALTMAQVRKFKCPPNFVKFSDSRATGYEAKYGQDCWELDALKPKYLIQLIQDETEKLLDRAIWDKTVKQQEDWRKGLVALSDNFTVASRFVGNQDAVAQFEEEYPAEETE